MDEAQSLEVPGYTLVRPLGAGGMATVYLARQDQLDRHVALKVLTLPASAKLRHQMLERFRIEAHALAQLSHPNIVVVHDHGETGDGRLYLAMELLGAGSLDERVESEGPVPLTQALRLLSEIAAGMRYAHKRGVVHRDLKLGNVMLNEDDDGVLHAKIVDFGLAKLTERDQGLTTPGLAMGSPQYMSPEQIAADGPIDHRADIYAFGVIVFRTVTGKYPFNGDLKSLLGAHVAKPPPPLGPPGAFPEGLEHLVQRCLAKEPEDRYPSFAEVLEELSVLTGVSLGSWSSTHVRVAKAPPRAWSTTTAAAGLVGLGAAGLAAAAVLATVALAAAGWWFTRPAPPPDPAARVEPVPAPPAPDPVAPAAPPAPEPEAPAPAPERPSAAPAPERPSPAPARPDPKPAPRPPPAPVPDGYLGVPDFGAPTPP